MKKSAWLARRHQRGAVLVEAAVVIPVFLLLFGGMLFMHHTLRGQQRVMMSAKDAAWTYAMASCRGGAHGVSVNTSSLAGPDLMSTMPGAPGAEVSLADVRLLPTARSTSQSSVTVSEGTLFSFQQKVSSHAVVSCDNQTESGDLGGVLRWLVDNAQGLFGGLP